MVVKVGDSGLSSDLYNKDYFRLERCEDPLPVRWLAVEVIKERVFTFASDVVSTYAYLCQNIVNLLIFYRDYYSIGHLRVLGRY